YSIVIMMAMSLVSLLLYYIMLGWPLSQGGLFISITMVGSLSLSAVFTFLSAIAARAHQNSALMAILGFPLVTPILMILSKLAVKALSPVYMPGWWGLALVLLALAALVI